MQLILINGSQLASQSFIEIFYNCFVGAHIFPPLRRQPRPNQEAHNTQNNRKRRKITAPARRSHSAAMASSGMRDKASVRPSTLAVPSRSHKA